ncbi:hypothetical protein O9H85_21495 [Paenibacillus filicis]|uniref:Uncharacterized protein n=1 Tax=Paenibacillus gyeongsangnamensis TaxID=3388067 RepID=A0ABT4QDM2_9BACL|nr:hypothetical protein [Paenibacillus filicis]MCZ8514949.1 hypothetical protein [Paenibacillus filicis]
MAHLLYLFYACYKQRHTAMRIHKRLMTECIGYDASYPLVQRYVELAGVPVPRRYA